MIHDITKKTWTKKQSLVALRRSDIYGFWLRLKTLGFSQRFRFSTKNKNNIIYMVNNWIFEDPDTNETVTIKLRRNRAILIITVGDNVLLRKSEICSTRLEQAFLHYFDQEDKPLFIPRLGKQSEVVREWQNYWIQHVKDNGKWTKRIMELRVLPPLMPVAQYKPRPRAYKPRQRKGT